MFAVMVAHAMLQTPNNWHLHSRKVTDSCPKVTSLYYQGSLNLVQFYHSLAKQNKQTNKKDSLV